MDHPLPSSPERLCQQPSTRLDPTTSAVLVDAGGPLATCRRCDRDTRAGLRVFGDVGPAHVCEDLPWECPVEWSGFVCASCLIALARADAEDH
jgi:hypothetical protein